MGQLNNVRDGRKAKAFLATFGTTELTSVTLGKIYNVTAKATSDSAFAALEIGDFFVATGTTAPTLATGDKCVEVTPKFLGGATDKSLNFEKSTVDVTCDKDNANNIVSDGVVVSSGNVNCYDLLQSGETAANRIRQRFNKTVTYAAGAAVVGELDRTEKDVLIFVWDARDLETGEYIGIDFVPAFISSIGHDSAYGSGQTFNANFSGADSDEFGHRRSYHQFAYQSEFGEQLKSWCA